MWRCLPAGSGVTEADSESPCAVVAGEAGSASSAANGISVFAAPAASASASSPSPRGARLGERLLRRSESKKLLRSRSLEAPAACMPERVSLGPGAPQQSVWSPSAAGCQKGERDQSKCASAN